MIPRPTSFANTFLNALNHGGDRRIHGATITIALTRMFMQDGQVRRAIEMITETIANVIATALAGRVRIPVLVSAAIAGTSAYP